MRTSHNVSLPLLMLLVPALGVWGCAQQPEQTSSSQAEAPSAAATAAAEQRAEHDEPASGKARGGKDKDTTVDEEGAPHARKVAKPSSAPVSAHDKGAGRGRGYRSEAPAQPPAGPQGIVSGQAAPSNELGFGRDFDNTRVVDGQGPRDMFFRHYGVNPTIETRQEPVSTFSVDVDASGYTLARAFLDRGQMPDEAAVRVEELVNAFDYGYEPPAEEAFNVHAEAFPSPNRKGYHVVHIGVKGREVSKAERKPANLVFVVDVSGSMDMENRLGLVKRSLRLLVDQLAENDQVGIVVYGSQARAVLPPTSAHHRSRILQAIDGLRTEGATNAEAGLKLGYQMAARHLRSGAINRVVLCSDGVANVGITGPGGILETVERERSRGITISTVGVGMGNYNDVLMEQLADKGNGNYYYVDRLDEARRVFVDNLTGTLEVIAKDVKIQVEFDPQAVARYRLIGYENRALDKRDFANDRVDAGEIGAGHSVTALYEVKLTRPAGDFATLRIRYKPPQGQESTLLTKPLPSSIVRGSFDSATAPSQLSYLASCFGEKLRGSYWVRNVSYAELGSRHGQLPAAIREQSRVAELGRLIRTAERLDRRGDKFERELPVAMMDFDRVPVLR